MASTTKGGPHAEFQEVHFHDEHRWARVHRSGRNSRPQIIVSDASNSLPESIALGDGTTIAQPYGSSSPWWLCYRLVEADRLSAKIPLKWCSRMDICEIARMFGIVGPDPTVTRSFRGSPAWEALIVAIARDPIGAEAWSRADEDIPGWWSDAVLEYKCRHPGAILPRETRDPALVYHALRTEIEKQDESLPRWPEREAPKRLSLVGSTDG